MSPEKPGDSLADYNKKRDFTKTAEPPGEVEKLEWGGGAAFIVQKHEASRLHYDFRLELDGVLKSWAVPKGPSPDPADKRLAVRTEDHPLSYALFEGVIPKGEYGGGSVMLWDRGVWSTPPGKDPREGLREGRLHILLHGERMEGEWILLRMKPRPGERGENWMLRKLEDAFTDGSTSLTDRFLTSVRTGRTMQEIAAGKEAKEIPYRGTAAPVPSEPASNGKKPSSGRTGSRAKGGPPAFREPQKATLVAHAPDGSGWLNEMKYDGYRCLLALGGGDVRIYTRSGLNWTERFPEIAAAAREIDAGSALLDGEIVSIDRQGGASFSALQQAISEGGRGLTLFLFDALEINGEDLAARPLIERKQRLASLIGQGRPPFILYAQHIVGEAEKLLAAMCESGQEGIISKQAEAPYRSGRTRSWLKIKCTLRQEFVIIGWTESDKARGFRSLLLAVNESGSLRYSGKVGTGFSMQVMDDLLRRLRAIERKTAPTAVPAADARGAHWVRPELVAEVAFAEFTSGGIIRHGSFLGLRADKAPEEVVTEQPAPDPLPARPHHDVKLTNPDRLIYPDAGITKGDLFAYYEAIGPLMLEWAANRPLSLVRCPQGRSKKCFFQKHNTGSFGPHVHSVPIREKDGALENYLYIENLTGILACVQMGTIEFHGWGSGTADIEKPDRLVFDLDPDESLTFSDVRKAAQDLRHTLAGMGLQSFPLLTGGKGIHVVIPLKKEAAWPEVEDFTRRFAIAVATSEPDRFTSNMSKARRKGRIFLDYLRNRRGSTAIMPYSARPHPGAPVAAPVNWSELENIESSGHFTIRDSGLLLERASSAALSGWGEASQILPAL